MSKVRWTRTGVQRRKKKFKDNPISHIHNVLLDKQLLTFLHQWEWHGSSSLERIPIAAVKWENAKNLVDVSAVHLSHLCPMIRWSRRAKAWTCCYERFWSLKRKSWTMCKGVHKHRGWWCMEVRLRCTPNPMLQQKRCISHSFSKRPPGVQLRQLLIHPAMTLAAADSFLKLSPTQLFRQHHTAAANHVSRRSDTGATQWMTRLDVTRGGLAMSIMWTPPRCTIAAHPCQLSAQCLIWCEWSLSLGRVGIQVWLRGLTISGVVAWCPHPVFLEVFHFLCPGSCMAAIFMTGQRDVDNVCAPRLSCGFQVKAITLSN